MTKSLTETTDDGSSSGDDDGGLVAIEHMTEAQMRKLDEGEAKAKVESALLLKGHRDPEHEYRWRRLGPAVFTRAWCLLEAFIALRNGAKLHVCLRPDDEKLLLGILHTRGDEMTRIINSIDIRHSQVETQEEVKLFNQILNDTELVGTSAWEAVGKTVRDAMHLWFGQKCQFVIGKRLVNSDHKQLLTSASGDALVVADVHDAIQLDPKDKVAKDDEEYSHPAARRHIGEVVGVGGMWHRIGVLEDEITRCGITLGREHPHYLTALTNHALLLSVAAFHELSQTNGDDGDDVRPG